MSTPKRIQRRRSKGWRMPEGAVYVGRPSRWGNPFVVGALATNRQTWGERWILDRTEAVDYFRRWVVEGHMDWRTGFGPTGRWSAPLGELRGRDLVCWCPLDEPCHADVLLELANAPTTTEVAAARRESDG